MVEIDRNELRLRPGLRRKEFTYKNIAVAQGYSSFNIDDIILKTKLSRNIELNIPIVASPMDTVTEADMAIAMALQGGIGVLHYNFPGTEDESIKKQLEEAKKVKRYKAGFVCDLITVSPNDPITKLIELEKAYGYSTFPVIDNESKRLVGLITEKNYSRDPEYGHLNIKIAERMRPLERLITAEYGISLKEANDMLINNEIGILPIINKNNELQSAVFWSDLKK